VRAGEDRADRESACNESGRVVSGSSQVQCLFARTCERNAAESRLNRSAKRSFSRSALRALRVHWCSRDKDRLDIAGV